MRNVIYTRALRLKESDELFEKGEGGYKDSEQNRHYKFVLDL